MPRETIIRPDVSVRWLVRRDVPAVLAIERASFELPWTEAEFLAYLRRPEVVAHVALHAKIVVGYAVVEVAGPETEILNLAVAPEYRRLGIGRMLVDHLMRKPIYWRPILRADVVEFNLAMHLFLRAMGFRCVAIVSDRYLSGDAYRFERHRDGWDGI